ncbi:MAG: SDR family NAD(P)-dependent oxidoreductase [Parachlamydiaceae bacterium]|nr:SDR family NAD(P)-dependent oxidoreductase [Parachlamydiaceae bacterium]
MDISLENYLLSIFDNQLYSQQPTCLLNLSNSSENDLNVIYEFIKDKTCRGKVLNTFPVFLAQSENNQKKTLKNNHSVENSLKINLKDSDPSKIFEELFKKGIQKDNILYIVAYTHDIKPKSLLKPWASFFTKNGFLLVSQSEEKKIKAKSVKTFETFLMDLANLQFFPKTLFQKYSSNKDKIPSLYMEKRDYRIRYAKESDLPRLVTLEKRCWATKLQMSQTILGNQIKKFSEGQLVLELDKEVVGVIYSQKIIDEKLLCSHTSKNVFNLHNDEGHLVQLLAINIIPEKQHLNLGDDLLEFMLLKVSSRADIQKVVAVTRCKEYLSHPQFTYADYIKTKDSSNKYLDPILRFHQLHGADIAGVVKNYRAKDEENCGNGILVSYDLLTRKRFEIQPLANKNQSADVDSFIKKTIEDLLGVDKALFEVRTPLMEMGLDSADLLKLKENINFHFGMNLNSSFFFKYNSAEKVIENIKDQLKDNKDVVTEKTVQETVVDNHRLPGKEFAIIGLSCRFPPNINNLDDYWNFLKLEKSAISNLPEGRWQWPFRDMNDFEGINKGGFIDDIRSFDASFFRISRKEAELMDPQQRILLELAWHTLEDAGYAPSVLSGSETGVFVGASGSDYGRLLGEYNAIEPHFGTGIHMSILPNRISYFFNFKGPSIIIDTACSSSLVAIHEAIKSIESGDCKQALVGGINIMCHPLYSILYYKSGMLAKDGKCKTFDADANGYVRSEGAAMLLLKPLEDAIRAKDSIYAIIKGSAINHGGVASGLTVPNPESQSNLVIKAFQNANVSPSSIGYIEAHGTGTKLGDPIEVQGLKEAFAKFGRIGDTNWCGLGSVKSNMGHLEAVAGLAGLFKVIKCLQTKEIPATINYHKLNPNIQLENSPFYITATHQKWTSIQEGVPLRAGLSSFGCGGANAHTILEEYKREQKDKVSLPANIFIVSAKNQESLKRSIINLYENLLKLKDKSGDEENLLSDICYTLQIGREPFSFRFGLIISNFEDLLSQLSRHDKINERICKISDVKKDLDVADFDRLVNDKNFEAILNSWLGGSQVDWRRLYKEITPSRINLPGYVFNKEQYWIIEHKQSEVMKYNAFLPKWDTIEIQKIASDLNQKDHIAVICDSNKIWNQICSTFPKAKRISLDGINDLSLINIDQIIWIAPPTNFGVLDDRIIEEQDKGVIQLFNLIKTLSSLGQLNRNIGFTIVTERAQQVLKQERINPTHSSVHGFFGSMAKEFPNFSVRLIDVDDLEKFAWHHLYNIPFSTDGNTRCFRNGSWYQLALQPLSFSKTNAPLYKKEGVYVVIGGAGGIGEKWSEYMIRHYNAKIVWIGRREKNTEIENKIKHLSLLGCEPLYFSGNANDPSVLNQIYIKIKEVYPHIDGVVHSAIGILDNSIINTDVQRFKEGLSAKIDLSVRMAQVFSQEPLDFLLYFSSIVALTKDHGKCSYAAGSVFEDAFAYQLSSELNCKVAVVNWGFWGDIGVGANIPISFKNRLSVAGIGAIEPQEAFETLDLFLRSEFNQMVYAKMDNPLALGLPLFDSTNKKIQIMDQMDVVQNNSENINQVRYAEQLTQYLKNILSQVLKISTQKIDVNENLESYGIDSILISQMTKLIKKNFENITTTIFFECKTLNELVQHMIKHQGHVLSKLFGETENKNETKNTIDIMREPQKIISSTCHRKENEPIAIIGLAGRYPKAKNLAEFWENLKAGKECANEIPNDRWSLEGFYESNKSKAIEEGKSYSKWGAFIDDFADFDPLFFNISPKDAMAMDPQERIFLQSCWEALEDAGYTREKLEKNYNREVGVFAGITKLGYNLYGPELWKSGKKVYPRTSFSSLANRVSYFLNLSGPSLPIDTMCSSSLAAIHEACESIRHGRCQMAFAGGVNLYLHPFTYVELCFLHMLSEDGKCKSFGQNGDGFVPGEGVGVVLLKPLSRAILDKDHIYGVIKSTNINHGGKTNGYTVPSPQAQSNLLQKALEEAKIDSNQLSYIEAHGTGTALGDPIEFSSITQALKNSSKEIKSCALGSIKPNIGHLESAAGIAGLTKVLLQMKNNQLVPSLNAKALNSNIDFRSSPLYVQQDLTSWPRPIETKDGRLCISPRAACVLSFGAGGSNACVVVEEFITTEESARLPSSPVIIVISAKSKERLIESAKLLAQSIEKSHFNDNQLLDIAYTLQTGREAMECRVAMIVGSIEELKNKLNEIVFQAGANAEGIYYGDLHGSKEIFKNLTSDADGAYLLQSWIIKKKFHKLCEMWVNGVGVDWEQLYENDLPRKMSLPTYPFAKERYWIRDIIENNDVKVDVPGNSLKTFEEYWEPVQLVSSKRIGNIVCLGLSENKKETVLNQLNKLAPDCNVHFASDENKLKKISQKIKVDTIWYFGPLEKKNLRKEYGHLVHLLQCINRLNISGSLLIPFEGDPLEMCYGYSWIGFEKSLGLVLSNLKIAMVYDLNKIDLSEWVSRLWAACRLEKIESLVFKEEQANHLALRPYELKPAPSLLRKNGTYLITGGCGGLGLLFAEYITKKVGNVNLILSGRSQIDQKKNKKIQHLEALGANVQYLQADVSQLDRMKEEIKKAKNRFGEINGVLHVAGLQGRRNLLDKDLSEFEEIISSKVQGTQVLDELLKDESPEFVCYFSSTAAILGDFGSCDYAVGNRFQMAYTDYRNATKRTGKTVVINWPLWKEGGMGLEDDQSTHLYLKTSGQRLLEVDEGTSHFDTLLSQKNTQFLVVAGAEDQIHFLEQTHDVEQKLSKDLKNHISQIISIQTEKINEEANLADLGFDSISLTALAHQLGRFYNISLTPSIFFTYATIKKVKKYLLTNHTKTLENYYRVKVATPKIESQKEIQPIQTPNESIAIIGMSGRFPGARNIEEFWQILIEGKETITEIPSDRFDWTQYYGDAANDPFKTNSKWIGSIPGVREFDNTFFGISPKESKMLDPRQRLLLQEGWKALEDAGYGKKDFVGQKIGVYIGVEQGDYQSLNKENESNITSNHEGILASRLSYFLNLDGPVLAINTSCSSGLVAVHQACSSLLTGECDAAIAGGVSLSLSPEIFVAMAQAGMLSDDGKCYTFDQKANGLVPGEAVATVVLKKLSRAIVDKDPIYAIIKASGMNYDGKTNGITAPSGEAQTKLIKSTYEKNHIKPEQIEYIVTHGTGTKLGDPVEVNALIDAFNNKGRCAMTSTKTNFGHTFAASGVVNLICLALSLYHKKIPKSLNYDKGNEYINWKDSPFYVNESIQEWDKPQRLGAVSAFGMSGTNVHMVLENYDQELPIEKHAYYLILLSAKSEKSLEDKTNELIDYLEDEEDLSSISYTLIEGRQHFEYRKAVVATNKKELIEKLNKKGIKTDKKEEEIFIQQETEKEFKRIAELYCQGYTPRCKEKHQKIHVPTYPFERNEFWIVSGNKSIPKHILNEFSNVAPLKITLENVRNDQVESKITKERLPISLKPTSNEINIVKSFKIDDKENDQIKETITLSLATFLDMPIDRLDLDARFIDLGLDSIIGVEWLRSINKQYNLNLQATKVYDYPTINELSVFIQKELGKNTISSPPQDLRFDSENTEVETFLMESLAILLDLRKEHIHAENSFIDIGLDSIIGVEWVRVINRKYNVGIQATKVYDYPNIKSFAQYLSEMLEKSAQGSLKEILQKVQLGILDIEVADQLIK